MPDPTLPYRTETIAPHAARRRKLRSLLRKIGVLISAALILWAIALSFGVDVSTLVGRDGVQHEQINGRDDASGLLLPLGLFLVGIAGLAGRLG